MKAKAEDGWGVYDYSLAERPTGRQVHVAPVRNLDKHLPDFGCPCSPDYELTADAVLIIHREEN